MAWALAVASGLAAAFAFPPFDLWVLAWVAPALLLLALRGARPGLGFARGVLAGFMFQSLCSWWLLSAGLNPGQFLLVALVFASYWGAFGAAAVWLERHRARFALLAIPSVWCVLEWLRANLGWLAEPWSVLGYSQWPAPAVARVGAVAGVFGVSFVLVGNATLALELVGGRADRGAGLGGRTALALALVSLLGAGTLLELGSGEPGRTVRVALVQAGSYVPGNGSGAIEARRVFERYRDLTRAAAMHEPALIAWPESSMPASLPSDAAARGALASLARETRAHLLVGTSGRDKSRPGTAEGWANSAFLFSPEGEIVARYDKIRLLPFNEYVPLRHELRWPAWIAGDVADAEAGLERTVFEVEGARFGALICWENLFGREFRRSAGRDLDFMVSLTNEAFAPRGPARQQMFEMNAWRAIENGLPVIRAATTGISAFVGADGRVLARLTDAAGRDLDVEGFSVRDVPIGFPPTFYRRHGDWIVSLAAVTVLTTLGLGREGAWAT